MKFAQTSQFGPGLFRLFLAFVVVVHHSFPLRLGNWAVYVFFAMSGYWISMMWETKYKFSRNRLFTFYTSRWWRLAPVFLVCTALGLLAELYLSNRLPFGENLPLWLLLQFPIAGSSSIGRVIPPTWSLDVEMQFYLIAPFLIATLSKVSRYVSLLIMAVSLTFSLLYFSLDGKAEIPTLLVWLPIFIAGILVHLQQWKPSLRIATLSAGATFAFFASLLALPATRNLVWLPGSERALLSFDFLRIVAPLFGALLVLPFLAWNVHVKSGLFDHWMGNLAYPLYLFHWIPREFYYALADWKQPQWVNILLLIGNFACAFLGAIAILHFVDQPLDRLRNAWVRSRLFPAQDSSKTKQKLHF